MAIAPDSVNAPRAEDDPMRELAPGLSAQDAARVARACERVKTVYGDKHLGTGEELWSHGLGMARIASSLRLDADTRLAALLFATHEQLPDAGEFIEREYSAGVARLVEGLHRLNGLRLIARTTVTSATPEVRAQAEILRKMLLAMVEDIRVVLLRLASRTQTLRYFVNHPGPLLEDSAREALDIYAPLANRLGVGQLKWELEDLSFRLLDPETYHGIARQLEEEHAERDHAITEAIARLKAECAAAGLQAEIYGRPKHIYSIWKKMRAKGIAFSQVYDLRALRVIVDQVKDCYTVLGIVQQIWEPVAKEFDDYIAKPKGNAYQSLHTAVIADDDAPLEVQIRTWDMHSHAELGVAAHWRYKEGASSGPGRDPYGDKLGLLRQLLSWRDEITDASDWLKQFKQAALDDTIYVITPQGRVLDLPRGATPIDFAYRVHTEVGHRCRGAKVDGVLVPLNKPLASGQTVEIITAKQGGPSRDWLNPQLGYLQTSRGRTKVKQWFTALEEDQTIAEGRTLVQRELQRCGATQTNIDGLAAKLDYADAKAMFLAAGRGDLGVRALELALRGPEPAPESAPGFVTHPSKAGGKDDGILIVGVGKLLTQLGRCCKPVPPDRIGGYVTHGRGVSIHRTDCPNFANMVRTNPERNIAAAWSGSTGESSAVQAVYPVDVSVECADRTGLLRDITEVLLREKINVTAVNTISRQATAYMKFTLEVRGVPQLQQALKLVREIPSVINARRL